MQRERPIRVQRGQTCPLCRAALLGAPEAFVDCPACGVVYHAACARELAGGGCATVGCAHRLPPTRPVPVEKELAPGTVAVSFADRPRPPGGAPRARSGLPAPLAYLVTTLIVLLVMLGGLGAGWLIGGMAGFWLGSGVVLAGFAGANGLLSLLRR